MPYIANTAQDRKEMLQAIGVESFDELWHLADVHESPPRFNLPEKGLSELEVLAKLGTLARENRTDLICFTGGGVYDHFVPAAISHVVERGEFLTSYTPYQPEASQGTLQAVYEYQSAMCRLTGMEVSNASLYDGGTALFEAILMALRRNRRRKVLIAGTLSPIYQAMVRTSSHHLAAEVRVTSDEPDQCADELLKSLDEETSSVVIQYPDFYGTIRDWTPLVIKAREKGITPICSVYPLALALLKTPGEMGFEIVTGEGQSLGIPLSFGGPYLGFMTTTSDFMRKMPGRICGRTKDLSGKPGFVLTLQAREQHIRREKATSNICTNESLCALRAIIYLALMGKTGFRRVGELCASKASFAAETLISIPGVRLASTEGFFNEFVIELPVDAKPVVSQLLRKGFMAGIPLGAFREERNKQVLLAVTEKRTREEIVGLAEALGGAL